MDMNNNNYFLLFIEYLYKLPLSTSSYTNNRRKSTMTRIVFIYFGVICQFVIFPMNSFIVIVDTIDPQLLWSISVTLNDETQFIYITKQS